MERHEKGEMITALLGVLVVVVFFFAYGVYLTYNTPHSYIPYISPHKDKVQAQIWKLGREKDDEKWETRMRKAEDYKKMFGDEWLYSYKAWREHEREPAGP